MPFFLGLDNGGTVTKAALFDETGREIAVHAEQTEMLYPASGCTERNLDDLWSANIRAVRGVLARSGISGRHVAALAVTGYGNGIIMLGKDGRPVHDGIVSTDTRARSVVQGWYADGTFDRVFPHTIQSIWPAQPVALLAWFRRNRPEVLESAKWVMMCKDYIRYRLTGEIAAEISDYSGTSAIDLTSRSYSPEVFDALGIPECLPLFPPLVHSTAICGRVSEAAAASTGLAPELPVAGGLFDIHASSLASGVTEPGILSCVAGTWTINQVLLNEPLRQKDIFMNSISPVNGMILAMEGSATSTSNLDWFIRETFGEQSPRGESAAAQNMTEILESCNRLADSVDPSESGVVFLPFLYGSNVGSPSQAAFLGLECRHHRAHLVRAVYEGIIFATRMHIERLLRNLEKPGVIRLAGGPARSSTWVHLYADTLNLPVEVVKVSEMGALGAAMCAAVAGGVYPDLRSAAERMVVTGDPVVPDARVVSVMNDKYGRYLSTLDQLRSLRT